MPKLYVLIGIPGSGKSTWAENFSYNTGAKIFSSDKYREKMFGSAEDQTHNSEVFSTLYKDCKDALVAGDDCIFDATNINRKSRRGILDTVSHLEVEKIAIIFATPLFECKWRNEMRSRKVPEYVLEKMVQNFELPLKGEGFDIISVYYSDSCFEREPYDEIEQKVNPDGSIHFNTIRELGLNALGTTCYYDESFDMDQHNKHHSLSLVGHELQASQYIIKSGVNRQDLEEAALCHDIGKYYTQTFDENGEAHYYNHDNVGAYHILTKYKMSSPFKHGEDQVLNLATLVNYHMIPYFYEKMGEKKKKLTKKELVTIWDDIMLLHEADVSAH